MGAYGSERTTQPLQDFPMADSEEEAEEVSQETGRVLSVPLSTGVCSSARSLTQLPCATHRAGGWCPTLNGRGAWWTGTRSTSNHSVVAGSPGENLRLGVWGRGLSIGKGGERVSSSVLGWV